MYSLQALLIFYNKCRKILIHECAKCPEPKVFFKFEELEQHMRKQHELFCCKLCAKHLKVEYCILMNYVFAHTLFLQWIVCSVFRYSPMSGSGTIGKSWLDIECKGTRMIPRIVGIRFVNSVMTDTWTTMNCWSTCGEIITSAISVTQMELRSITGKRPILIHFVFFFTCSFGYVKLVYFQMQLAVAKWCLNWTEMPFI